MAQFLPKPYKREPVTVRLSNEKLERIDSLAAAFHISRSELINQCIDFALEQMEEEEHGEKRDKPAGSAAGRTGL